MVGKLADSKSHTGAVLELRTALNSFPTAAKKSLTGDGHAGSFRLWIVAEEARAARAERRRRWLCIAAVVVVVVGDGLRQEKNGPVVEVFRSWDVEEKNRERGEKGLQRGTLFFLQKKTRASIEHQERRAGKKTYSLHYYRTRHIYLVSEEGGWLSMAFSLSYAQNYLTLPIPDTQRQR